MKPLPLNYFYGVGAAAAVASGVTGSLWGLTIVVETHRFELGMILGVLFFGWFGLVLGWVPAVLLLAIPLAIAVERGLSWRVGACITAAVAFDAVGLLHLQRSFPLMEGFRIQSIGWDLHSSRPAEAF